ncbi:flagellar basal body-associated FliL family protein [Mangrovibacter yixingensis]|uniref:flagellar basal body-associated FliL family protein n=1 Tax=Mangrovibacter yixingensis TaxID=1529639 RepID=UPI001CFE494D|nr:flagellar basal body-associated FliL family protein [Mangrovibacter yixingensis]
MNIKIILSAVVLALCVAAGSAALTLFGLQHMGNKHDQSASTTGDALQNRTADSVEFVEIANLIVTLKGNNGEPRYLLLEQALITTNPEDARRTQTLLPALRGAAVGLLNGLPYTDVRGMSVEELTQKLTTRYDEQLQQLNTSKPFEDVIISKMVFQ